MIIRKKNKRTNCKKNRQGLKINIEKTKEMCIGNIENKPITIINNKIEKVKPIKYLGVCFD